MKTRLLANLANVSNRLCLNKYSALHTLSYLYCSLWQYHSHVSKSMFFYLILNIKNNNATTAQQSVVPLSLSSRQLLQTREIAPRDDVFPVSARCQNTYMENTFWGI